MLWPLARTGDPSWLKPVGVACALAFAWPWLRHRPVGRLAALVVLFGYFTAYRYPVVVRTYALLLPTLAWLCVELRRARPRPWLAFPLAGLVALNGAFGTLLSLALLPVIVERCGGRIAPTRRTAAGIVLWTACAAACAAFVILPVKPDGFVGVVLQGEMADDYRGDPVVRRAVLPHVDRLPLGVGPWIASTPAGAAVSAVLTAATVVAVFALLGPWRAGQLAWTIGVAGIAFAARMTGLVEERHSGHILLLAVALVWVRPAALRALAIEGSAARAARPVRALRAIARPIVAGAALYHAAIALAVAGIDLDRDVSHSRATTALIDARDPGRRALVLTGNAFDAAGTIAYRDRPVHDTDCDCTVRYRADTRIVPPPSPARIETIWCGLIDAGRDVVAMFPDGRHRPDARHEILGTVPTTERFARPMPVYRLKDPAASCASPRVGPR